MQRTRRASRALRPGFTAGALFLLGWALPVVAQVPKAQKPVGPIVGPVVNSRQFSERLETLPEAPVWSPGDPVDARTDLEERSFTTEQLLRQSPALIRQDRRLFDRYLETLRSDPDLLRLQVDRLRGRPAILNQHLEIMVEDEALRGRLEGLVDGPLPAPSLPARERGAAALGRGLLGTIRSDPGLLEHNPGLKAIYLEQLERNPALRDAHLRTLLQRPDLLERHLTVLRESPTLRREVERLAVVAPGGPSRALPPGGGVHAPPGPGGASGDHAAADEDRPPPGEAGVDLAGVVPAGDGSTWTAEVAGLRSFDGIPATGRGTPDPVGDIGPSHYVQMVNSAITVFTRDAKPALQRALTTDLWEAAGGGGKRCAKENQGDPVVRYDRRAKRWILSQMAREIVDTTAAEPMGSFECLAISAGPDPTAAGWSLFDVPMGSVDKATGNTSFVHRFDFPKIGIGGGGYFVSTTRPFPSGGVDVWALSRARLLAGASVQPIQFHLPGPTVALLPADYDGPVVPGGKPMGLFARPIDGARLGDGYGGPDVVEVWALAPDFDDPPKSTFARVAALPVDDFDSVVCDAGLRDTCIPQKDTDQRLEALGVWPSWRLAGRVTGGGTVLLLNHTVDVDRPAGIGAPGRAGIRWYELFQPTGGSWQIRQSGVIDTPGESRWMGTMAMDCHGNIVLAHTVSSPTRHPSLQVSVWSPGRPAGMMSDPIELVTGAGSKTTKAGRWGDYATIDVDPVDDRTFWLTSELYRSATDAGWAAPIVEFRVAGFDACLGPAEP